MFSLNWESWKNLEFDKLDKKIWKFEQKPLKKLEKPGIVNSFYMLSSKILIDTKNLSYRSGVGRSKRYIFMCFKKHILKQVF